MRIKNGRPGYRVFWPAPAPGPLAPDPPNLEAIKEAQRQAWRIAQRKATRKKARAVRRRAQKLQKASLLDYKVIAADAKLHYNERRQEELNKVTELNSWNRAPRNIDEVQSILIAMAKKVGQVYGVHLSVGRQNDELIFLNDKAEAVVDPGGINNPATTIMCAKNHEIDSGDFLKLFAARSLYAALTIRFNQLDMSTSQVPAFEHGRI